MFELRPKNTLGGQNHGWLDTKHHFSFANYHDPKRTQWGVLRVLNDDTIAPGTGFAPHPHKNMEIITYVREGAISHRDNLGNFGRTRAGEVQVMTAGTGIVHEERNDEAENTKIFQIWLLPKEPDLAPRWASRPFPQHDPQPEGGATFVPLAAEHASSAHVMSLNADGIILGVSLEPGQRGSYAANRARYLYGVVASGSIDVFGHTLYEGDGIAMHDEPRLEVWAHASSQLLLIDAGPAL